MKFTEPSHGGRAPIDSSAASRTQARQGIGLEAHRGRIAGQCQGRHYIGFHVVEIQRLARAAPLLPPARSRGDSRQRFDLCEIGALRGTWDAKLFTDLE